MVGRLKPAVRAVLGNGFVVEAAVGEGSTRPFVKEEEQESNLDAFCREAIGVARSFPLQQGMTLELA